MNVGDPSGSETESFVFSGSTLTLLCEIRLTGFITEKKRVLVLKSVKEQLDDCSRWSRNAQKWLNITFMTNRHCDCEVVLQYLNIRGPNVVTKSPDILAGRHFYKELSLSFW